MQFVQKFFESSESLVSDLISRNFQSKGIFAFSSLGEFNGYQTRSSLTDCWKDNPGGMDMGLSPNLFLSIVIQKTSNTLIEHLEPARVIYVISLGIVFVRAEDIKWLFELNQMQRDGVCTALFVSAVKFAKLLWPSLRSCIPSRDLFVSKWIYDWRIPVFYSSFINLEQLTSSMTE